MSSISIVTADAFEFLKKLEPESVDLAVVDPPYNLGKAEWDTFKSHDDFLKFSSDYIALINTTLVPGGSFYLFNTPFNSAYLLPIMVNAGLQFMNWISWDKRDGISSAKTRFNSGTETILFFIKPGAEHTFNHDSVRVPFEREERATYPIVKNGKAWIPHPDGTLCGDIWRFSSERHFHKARGKTMSMDHPTPKPHLLIERIVSASSNSGDLVMDCFSGTGTTAAACKTLNRNFIGCEINPDYVWMAKNKLDETPTPLF